MNNVLIGFLLALAPSVLALAWLVWRAGGFEAIRHDADQIG
jgi:hypothetical protein